MKAEEVEVVPRQLGQQLRDLLRVDAELLRAAAHPHAGPLDLEVRIDADGDARTDPEALADHRDALGLGLRLHLDRHPGGDRLGQLGDRLARARRS